MRVRVRVRVGSQRSKYSTLLDLERPGGRTEWLMASGRSETWYLESKTDARVLELKNLGWVKCGGSAWWFGGSEGRSLAPTAHSILDPTPDLDPRVPRGPCQEATLGIPSCL